MNFPSVIRWGFDPAKSGIPVLGTTLGRLVWGGIRTNHIVDQHFNANCLSFVTAIAESKPESVDRLVILARRHGLHMFGTTDSGNSPDLAWWSGLFRALHGDLEVTHEAAVAA